MKEHNGKSINSVLKKAWKPELFVDQCNSSINLNSNFYDMLFQELALFNFTLQAK